MKDERSDIGSRIREFRKLAGMTQAEFGASVSIERGYVSKIETGGAPPSKRLLENICLKHGVNWEWLTTGEGKMNGESAFGMLEQKALNAFVVSDIARILSTMIDVLSRFEGFVFTFENEIMGLLGKRMNIYNDVLLKMDKVEFLEEDKDGPFLIKRLLEGAKSQLSELQEIVDEIEKRLPDDK